MLQTARRERGFSLIELLVVAAIMLILAGIAIGAVMKSRMAANEASAVNALRMINNAEVIYNSTYSSGYTDGLNRLGPPASGTADANNADLLDPVLSGKSSGGTNTSFVKSGYVFTYSAMGAFGQIGQYQVVANPVTPGYSGRTYYFTNQPLVIRYNPQVQASATDPPL